MIETTSLAKLFAKLNYFKDIDNKSDEEKCVALDDAINEFTRENRFPWTIQKSTLKVFKDIDYYAAADDQADLVILNNMDVDGYGDAASYYNTTLNQFIERIKTQRNLMTQQYINGQQVIGINNIQKDIFSAILDTGSDADNYEAVSGCTKVGLNNIYTLGDYKSISFNITGDPAEIKNTYTNSTSDEKYLEKYYIRRIYFKEDTPTNVELRLQTDDDNYISATVTEQVTGIPFQENSYNYVGFAIEEGTETGTFDEEDIASSKIIVTGYSGIMYVSYDSIDEFLLQQYWYHSKYPIMSSSGTKGDKEQFLNYEDNTYDIGDKLIGPTKWLDPVIKKARESLLMTSENEYLRNKVSSKAKKAEKEFERNFPNEQPKTTTTNRRFNNNPVDINYVP